AIYLDNYFTFIPLFEELRSYSFSAVTDDFRAKVRKQPAKTSTNSRIVRQLFKDKHTKELFIPRFINNYNHYIRGVNLANQFKESYETHRTTQRN
ncbi:hypothetical protein DL98DRAFT_442769, partial [Cadophora sp. DSE1049]